MSNSPLVCYTRLSPNHSGQRNHAIDTITPHYMAGNCTIETCGAIFAPTSRQASSNYGIGSDGRVGMYVEEGNRSWCSSSGANDHRAVTIECANLSDGSLTSACWKSLVALCADICRRNGKTRLVYRGKADYKGLASGDCLLTMHKWFGSTDCPGPWLSHQFARLATEVNAALGGKATVASAAKPANNTGGGKLDVDGYGGYNTVLDMQHALGTYEDGVISGQWRGNRDYLWAMEAVEWGGQGSQMVRALQRLVGAGVDGIWGKETSTRLQSYLIGRGYSCGDCGADGYFGRESVKALQRCLNDGKLR